MRDFRETSTLRTRRVHGTSVPCQQETIAPKRGKKPASRRDTLRGSVRQGRQAAHQRVCSAVAAWENVAQRTLTGHFENDPSVRHAPAGTSNVVEHSIWDFWVWPLPVAANAKWHQASGRWCNSARSYERVFIGLLAVKRPRDHTSGSTLPAAKVWMQQLPKQPGSTGTGQSFLTGHFHE